ncbi:MAG: CoA ester lyase, partial [Comamonadaceae bacterium]
LADVTARTGGRTRILPIIESAAGMWDAMALARSDQVERLVFGSIDFQHDLSIDGDDQELLFVRSQLVLISRVAGLQSPVDGVTVAIHDLAQVRADTTRARRLGFGAKLCIHPAQVAAVQAGFGADAAALAWARRVLDAAAAADGAAVAVDGEMVDKPVLARAHALLAQASASGATRTPP